MAKTRKGGKGKNQKSGKKRGAPKKRAGKPAGKKKLVAAPGGLGGGRPSGGPMEIDPGYYILKQYAGPNEYEVGRVLVEPSTNKEHWFMYNLTQPTAGKNGYTYPSPTQGSYRSPNVSTRFVYQGGTPPTIAQICQAVGAISIYKILSQSSGSCS